MLTQTLPRISVKTGQMMAFRKDAGHVRHTPTSRLRKFAWAGAVLAVVGAGFYFRQQSTSTAAEHETQAPTRQVTVITPQRAAAKEIVLPATIQAFQATDLFARANGYLKAWHVDIGASVKAGQILAEIETPELDQELAQAIALLRQGDAEFQQSKAELEEAKADLVFAQANVLKIKANLDYSTNQADRYGKLANAGTVARDEYEGFVRDREAQTAELASAKADVNRRKTNLDTRKAIIDSKEAIVHNREANVQRLRDLTGFQKVVAPFDGIVTRRNAEVGMLVSAGSNVGTSPLFSVSQVDVLRVHAAVPQSSALGIKAGDQVWVSIPEKPGQVYAAMVARTAGAVEPNSRSLLVEVELPNSKGELLPGLYVQVRFNSPSAQADFVIPTQALQMRSAGTYVVKVLPDGTLQAHKVTLGRDFGNNVEVVSGLQGDERLVLNPSDDLRDGQFVQIAEGKNSFNQ
ncbi:MAG TPA: efflux RND transporter periplasmic adaptor subunit, partial [Gemmataceae bacterium]|nr:efflux RND transporter periplasmic adaptor subunit [Gemmataceae bacterium]